MKSIKLLFISIAMLIADDSLSENAMDSRPYVSSISEASCAVVQSHGSQEWTLESGQLQARSAKRTTNATTVYRCSWVFPDFKARRVTFEADEVSWHGFGRGGGPGGAHEIIIRDASRNIRASRVRRGSRDYSESGVAIVARFDRPTDEVLIDFSLRDTWDTLRVYWTLEAPRIRVTIADQQ